MLEAKQKETSDIDFAVDITGKLMKKKLTGIYMEIFEELKEAVGHDIDLVELETLFDSQDKPERKALL